MSVVIHVVVLSSLISSDAYNNVTMTISYIKDSYLFDGTIAKEG